jgi:hypothetical protein
VENSKQENNAFATGSTIQTRREDNLQKIPNWKITLLLLDLLSKPVGKIICGKFQTGKY